MPVILTTQERDQEDCISKPAWANSSRDPILKKAHHKNELAEWLKLKTLSSRPCLELQKNKRKKENVCVCVCRERDRDSVPCAI
jgi:hypothetical protein